MADLASLLPLIAPMVCLLLGCVLFLVLLELFPLPGFIRTYRRRVREQRDTLGALDFDDPDMLIEKPGLGLKHAASARTGSYRVSPAG